MFYYESNFEISYSVSNSIFIWYVSQKFRRSSSSRSSKRFRPLLVSLPRVLIDSIFSNFVSLGLTDAAVILSSYDIILILQLSCLGIVFSRRMLAFSMLRLEPKPLPIKPFDIVTLLPIIFIWPFAYIFMVASSTIPLLLLFLEWRKFQ